MRQFSSFACIDWSGAATERTPNIAAAVTQGPRDVALVMPERGWSRATILDWLSRLADSEADILIGLDLSPALPFADAGAYFPGWEASPPDARSLWSLVDTICAPDPHLAASSFVSHDAAGRHFRHQGRQGDLFPGGMGRMRVCEGGQAAMGLRPYSCFNLVGAAQVGKSSLTGMRVLHRLAGRIPVWPFDPVPAKGPCIVEIYTSLAARAAGVTGPKIKITEGTKLDAVLKALDARADVPERITDHASDALLTAAWMRRVASDAGNWAPGGLTDDIAATEGWTFGVV